MPREKTTHTPGHSMPTPKGRCPKCGWLSLSHTCAICNEPVESNPWREGCDAAGVVEPAALEELIDAVKIVADGLWTWRNPSHDEITPATLEAVRKRMDHWEPRLRAALRAVRGEG